MGTLLWMIFWLMLCSTPKNKSLSMKKSRKSTQKLLEAFKENLKLFQTNLKRSINKKYKSLKSKRIESLKILNIE